MSIALIVAGGVAYAALWLITAVVLYPWAEREDFLNPEEVALLGGIVWPVTLSMAIIGWAWRQLGQFVVWANGRLS